ncbi:MAG: circadian clock protein KaiC [Candidatus Altiarchaeales archaeon HGW-Altiarchaeales-3]|nr:MAG: circadian clock protein KaiC [Candidatus Altiarchaeales archaeon HGW-Altiarchaeales-3]
MPIQKTRTGISGFDDILFGGFPEGWTVLLSGSSGTGKTIFAIQYLYNGITKFNENSVFVACEESSAKIKRAVEDFGWDLNALEDEGKLIFIDAANKWITDLGDSSTEFGLGTLLREIENAVKKIGAKRVVIDPASTLLLQFERSVAVRRALHKIASCLENSGCTTVITVERPEALGMTTWKNVEDFVLDGVVILSSKEKDGKRMKNVEVMKMRGEYFLSGKHPMKITKNGIAAFPMPHHEPYGVISKERVISGIAGLDEMMHGGALSTDCTLIAGSTGTGKTLFCAEFIHEGVKRGENCLFISFEESPAVLERNIAGIGFDIKKAETEGKVTLLHESAIDFVPEEFLLKIKKLIDEKKFKRIIIDSVTAYYPAFHDATHYRDHLVVLLGLFKSNDITSIITSEMPELFGSFKVTNSGTSFIVDNIIILRYAEIASEMRKAISVLKMRGSDHEKGIREFAITSNGIKIEKKFEAMEGVLSGSARKIGKTTVEKLKTEFSRTLGPMGLEDFEDLKESPKKDIIKYIDTLIKDKILNKEDGEKFKERINIILN